MNVFDLHCDTIGECSNRNVNLRRNDMHLDLERAASYDNYTQVFAIWIPDDCRGADAVNYFNKTADYYYGELEKNSDIISPFGGETPVEGILAVEGGSACGGSIEGLHHLYNRGVRLITLAWKNTNEICGGAFSDDGFSHFGKDFVYECETLGIIIDVSHLNRKSFKELTEFYGGPIVASHSNADIITRDYAHKRNLSDWQIDEIKNRCGLIGLNYYTEFLEMHDCKGVDALKRQIYYFLDKGCENIIALGSDYDGCTIGQDLCGVEKLRYVYDSLKHEFSENIVNKLFYDNASRYFESIL